jgi:hypothetical protein
MAGFLLTGQASWAAGAAESGYDCWAVAATPAVEETGLPDLLTAELSTRQGIELVERQQLQPVLEALELDACFGGAAAGERLNLGRMVGADAVLLLALDKRKAQPDEGQPRGAGTNEAGGQGTERAGARKDEPDAGEWFLKLVVSDCRCGVRLWLEYLPYTPDRLEEIAYQCADLVDQTRRRFAGGIRQVIAVTPLLSRNLVHDYDHLQTGYASLLEGALLAYPGVAVIETEEARAVRRELDLGGDKLSIRVVPLFVEGEYEMSAATPDAEPAVRLCVRISDGKKTRTRVERTGLLLSEVPELLLETVAKRIVQLAGEDTVANLTREQQHMMLARRAEAFARFGAFEHSTGLREAALLLKPDDNPQQLALIGDYLRWHRARQHFHYARRIEALRNPERGEPGDPADAAWDNVHNEQLDRFRIIARHVEDVVRRRALNPREADRLVSTVHLQMFTTGCVTSDTSAECRAARERKVIADELFWNVYPLFPALDPGLRDGAIGPSLAMCLGLSEDTGADTHSPLRQYITWTDSAGRFLGYVSPMIVRTGTVDEKPDDSRTLEDLFRFLTQIASPTVPLPLMARMATAESPSDLNGMIAAGRLTADEVRQFYQRLKQTDQPLNVLYGRLGLLSLQVKVSRHEGPGPEAVDQVDAISKAVRDYDTGEPDYRMIASGWDHSLGKLRSDIAKALGDPLKEKRYPLPENPIPEIDPAPRVAFEPIEGVDAGWLGILKCTDRLDAAWTLDTVYAIPNQASIERVLSVERGTSPFEVHDRIYSVHWDGEDFWIACMTSGIHVISPTGVPIGHVGPEDGLPPYSARGGGLYLTIRSPTRWHPGPPWPLILYPTAPGQCIAIGTFGNVMVGTAAGDKRVWFALISAKRDERAAMSFDVRTFHTATRVSKSIEASDDVHHAFNLAWLTECCVDNRRLLLVGRQVTGAKQFTTGRRPLAIDLDTLEVSLFPACFHTPGLNWNPRYSVNGGMLLAHHVGIDWFSPHDAKPGHWIRTPLIDYKRQQEPELRPQLLEHDGAVYNPGAHWHRIHTNTWQVEKLTDVPVPLRYRFEHYGVSAHYGLLAWNTGDVLYRVRIDDVPPVAENLAALYPHIPAERRSQHDRAIEAVRQLGGSVDARWGACEHRWARPRRYEWRTIVYLSPSWEGRDAGLAHLDDLHNLRDLYLVGADVSNEGLRLIGQLDDLESLCLVETKATDAGLAHLQGLDRLVSLHLEGTAGGDQFGDAGLVHLGHFPNVEKLTLYGSGFTDQGIDQLKRVPALRELSILDTSFTIEGVSQLAEGKPLFRWHDDSRRQ